MSYGIIPLWPGAPPLPSPLHGDSRLLVLPLQPNGNPGAILASVSLAQIWAGGATTVGPIPPPNPWVGETWFDPATGALQMWDGTQWILVPPLFSATQNGLVSASGGGTANFLRADGTWAPPPSAGGNTIISDTDYVIQPDDGTIIANGNVSTSFTWTLPALSSVPNGKVVRCIVFALAGGATFTVATASSGQVILPPINPLDFPTSVTTSLSPVTWIFTAVSSGNTWQMTNDSQFQSNLNGVVPASGPAPATAVLQANGTWMNFATLTNATDDGAAATAGVAVGQLYRNGSQVMVRVS